MATAKRSEPGKGEIVHIITASPDNICNSLGEDFADTGWPIVVKIMQGLPSEMVAERLEQIAEYIRKSQMLEQKERGAERISEQASIDSAIADLDPDRDFHERPAMYTDLEPNGRSSFEDGLPEDDDDSPF